MPDEDKEWSRLRSIAKELISVKADRAKMAEMISKMKITLARLEDNYDQVDDKHSTYTDLFKKVYGETIPWKTLDGLVQKVAALPPKGKL